MKNLTILLSVCVMIVNSGQAQENVKVSNEDTLSVLEHLDELPVLDLTQVEGFDGDLLPIIGLCEVALTRTSLSQHPRDRVSILKALSCHHAHLASSCSGFLLERGV